MLTILHGQHFAIPPHVRATTEQGFLCQRVLSAIKIVTNQQRLAAFPAKIEQAMCLVSKTTKRTLKVGNVH
jgi:hypothetical protein